MGVNITSTSAPTYVPISTQTLLSSASTINFNSIPGTYTDLVLIINTKKTSGGAANPILTFNSGSSGSGVRIYSYGSATGTSIDTSNLYVGDYSTTFSQAIVHIQKNCSILCYSEAPSFCLSLMRLQLICLCQGYSDFLCFKSPWDLHSHCSLAHSIA